jgi:lipopolysaccharide/colanic/teichoic acid biosynthesis glycosyltransferase
VRALNGGITRLLDLAISLFGLIFLSPLFLLVALAVKCSSPGPIIYRSFRVGRDRRRFVREPDDYQGRLFTLYKFRTMVVNANGPRATRSGDPRVTSVGRVLRLTKLDELPQLYNIWVGDMSLVGPRPEDPIYVKTYSPAQLQVLRVKPGLTSPASLLHRHEEQLLVGPDWENTYRHTVLPAKLRIELEYLSRRTVSKDVRILAQTVSTLFARPADRRRSEEGSR